MKKGKLQRGLAMVLSAAMLLTGINYPSITAKAAETGQVVFEDDMEDKSSQEAGWTIGWDEAAEIGTESRAANEWATSNKTKWWSFKTENAAQTVTLTRIVTGVETGNYKASLDADGGKIAGTLSISVLDGTEAESEEGSVKQSKEIEFGEWDKFKTTVTEPLTLSKTASVMIRITITTQAQGWFDLDNIKLTQEMSDEEAKTAAVNSLKTLIDQCKALNASDYQAASWAALQTAISDAQAVYDDVANKSLAEIQAAITALQEAKDALVDAGLVENAGVIVDKVEGITDEFIRGVDISTYISLIDSGVKYKGWNGEELDDVGFFRLLKEAGVNYVRIRVWNDPYKDAEKKQGYGAGNCDVEKAARMGAWATQAGLKVMIDFHYSDFWADPGRQIAPKAWKDYTVEQKADAISTFTTESLNTIIAAGADVRMVQVGNETTAAICGEKDWANMATLFKAGCAAVKSVDPTILRAIHFTNPEKSSNMKGYAEKLNTYEVDYDVFASSYYPYWHGTLQNLTDVLSNIATTYNKKVMVAETSWASTMEDGDGQPNVVRKGNNDDTSVYAATPQGQAYEVRDVIDAVAKVGEAGIGVMYWEPAWLPVNVYHADAENAEQILAANNLAWETYGSGWASSHSIGYDTAVNEDNYGGSEWDNQAMFDFEGNPLPSLNVFKYVLTGATEPKKLDTIADSSIDVNFGENIADKLPTTVNGVYNDKSKAENLPVLWNQDDIAAIKGFGQFFVKGTVTYQTETMNTVCTVNVAPENLLLQGGFEEGRDKWKIEGTGYKSKTTDDPRSGQHCLGFYLGDADYEFTATQSVTVETPGTYSAFMYLQGGEEGEVTANIKLSNDTQNTSSDADASVKGWKVWQNPNTEDVKAAIGDTLTVTITVNGKATSWGSVDDIYLYLKQADPVYQVTYHLDSGVNAETNPVKFDGTKTIALADPGREGYTFKGWYTDSEFKNKITEIAKGTAKNLELYAKWEKVTVEAGEALITYELNGGTNHADNPAKYTEGQALELKDPSRERYTFKGWYTDSEFKNAFAGITSETKGNLKLYAKWEEITVAPNEALITYELNGGTNHTDNPEKYTEGQAMELKDPSREGYTFKGWYTDSEYKNAFAGITSETKGNLTLYAKWEKVTVEAGEALITYELNGGTNHADNPAKYTEGQALELKDPSREGFIFKGWYTDSELKNEFAGITSETKGNLKLYAKWEEITVAPGEALITYELNGGTNHADNPVKYTEGQPLELKDPSREGYTFKGWYTDSEFKNEFAGITSETKGNLTIYAKWEEEGNSDNKDVKVTEIKLDASTKKILRGKSFTLKVTDVLPKDATEKAVIWSTSSDKVAKVNNNGVVTAVGPGEAVITATAKDGSGVKAQCKIVVPYKITYKLNKGKNHKSNPSTYFKQKITLKNPTRKGYVFKGWYTDSKFKKKITSIAKTSKKDITLYAKWSKVTVKKASLKKVANVSGKKAKVTIKKVSGAKGYQILYSTDKKFKKNVKKVLTKKTTCTLTKLKKKKTYYVKVRAYKLDSKGEKVFGAYSKVKTVKIKK